MRLTGSCDYRRCFTGVTLPVRPVGIFVKHFKMHAEVMWCDVMWCDVMSREIQAITLVLNKTHGAVILLLWILSGCLFLSHFAYCRKKLSVPLVACNLGNEFVALCCEKVHLNAVCTVLCIKKSSSWLSSYFSRRLLDLGFEKDVCSILTAINTALFPGVRCQTVLLSATLTEGTVTLLNAMAFLRQTWYQKTMLKGNHAIWNMNKFFKRYFFFKRLRQRCFIQIFVFTKNGNLISFIYKTTICNFHPRRFSSPPFSLRKRPLLVAAFREAEKISQHHSSCSLWFLKPRRICMVVQPGALSTTRDLRRVRKCMKGGGGGGASLVRTSDKVNWKYGIRTKLVVADELVFGVSRVCDA